MCGRYALSLSPETVEALLEDFPLPDLRSGPMPLPRYNVAPTQPVLTLGPGTAFWAHWGFQRPDRIQVNARSEKLGGRPNRCLVVADGFFEWKRVGAQRLPYHFRPLEGGLWAFGGLHKRGSVVILTTRPNDKVTLLHDRMPVIVDRSDWEEWLEPERSPPAARLLAPFAAQRMEVRPVSKAVNQVSNDGPDCLAPRPEEGQMGFRF